ncbi:MAG: SGNH/GDSL hydrolase family protein [Planctomycetes bacterium]|nr:SGNH/GDSL hydrolase family protein [Planctomycetota bacterium]
MRAKALFLGLLAAAAIAEGTVRLLDLAPDAGFYGYPEGLLVQDARLGWRYQPGFRGRFLGPRYASIPIEINSRGFRGPEFSSEPSPDSFRIAGLGDSIAFGAGVREEETVLRRLEHRLRVRNPQTEVLNFGVNHYDAEREALLLESDVLPLRPNLVLLAFCLNDAGTEEGNPTLRAPLAVRLLRSSAVLRLAHRRVLGSSERYADSYQRLYLDRIEEDWRSAGESRVEAAIARISEASRRAGARLAVAAFPHRTQLGPSLRPAMQDRLASICDRQGAPFLDLREAYSSRTPSDPFLPGDPWHPSPSGHALAAEALAAFLERGGLLPTP